MFMIGTFLLILLVISRQQAGKSVPQTGGDDCMIWLNGRPAVLRTD